MRNSKRMVLASACAAVVLAGAAQAAPAWCGGYKSDGDNKAKWIAGYIKSEGYSIRVVNYMAAAACDKPDDSARQNELKTWREGYAGGKLSDAQFNEAMSLYLDKKGYEKQVEEACTGKWKSVGAHKLEQKIRNQTMQNILGCRELVPAADDMIAWADWANVSQVDRVMMMSRLMNNEGIPGSAFAVAANDFEALTLDGLEGELGSMTALEKVKLREWAGDILGRGKARYDKELQKLRDDDANYEKVIAAAKEGWDLWHKAYENEKDAMELARTFEQKFFAGDESVLQGCEQKLYAPIAAHITALKPKDETAAQVAASDMVTSRLVQSLIVCETVTDNLLMAKGLEWATIRQNWRGPRYAAYNYANSKFNELKVSFGMPYLPTGQSIGLAYSKVESKNPRQVSVGQINQFGQVASVKPGKGGAEVKFKKAKVKYREQECTEDKSAWEVVGGGIIRHPVYCKPSGPWKTETRQEQPVFSSSPLVAKLKPNQFTTWFIETKDGKRLALPRGIYADADQKKLVGYLGATWK